MNYIVTIKGHGDAIISTILSSYSKFGAFIVICNKDSAQLLQSYISTDKIIFGDFSGLYDIRKQGLLKALKSLFKLITLLKTMNYNDNIFFETNDFRYLIIKLFITAKTYAPKSNNKNIYIKRKNLFESTFNLFLINTTSQIIFSNKYVIIFPKSRITSKEIDLDTLNLLINFLKSNNTIFKIALFKNDKLTSLNKRYEEQVIYFNDISDLITLIESSDIVISSDSLPLHVTYFLNKQLIPYYNNEINEEWLPPGIGEFVFLKKSNNLSFIHNLVS